MNKAIQVEKMCKSYGADFAIENLSQSINQGEVFGLLGASGVMGLPLVIADYRHKKILKRFHTTPISPVIILMVQAAVSAMYSVASAFLVY